MIHFVKKRLQDIDFDDMLNGCAFIFCQLFASFSFSLRSTFLCLTKVNSCSNYSFLTVFKIIGFVVCCCEEEMNVSSSQIAK